MKSLRVAGIVCASIALALICSGSGPEDDTKLSPLVRCFAVPEKPAPPFADGKFIPQKGETISFIGGTNTFEQQKYSDLELLLQLAYPDLELKIRNLAWQGDTVYEQTRPVYYFTKKGDQQPGSVPDGRERVEPGIVLVNFGKMESLDGPDSLPHFVNSYRSFLDQLQTRTHRIVLVGPTPFFPVGPAKSLTDVRNRTLARFEGAIGALAGERGFLYVDLFEPLLKSFVPADSRDGIHLGEAGQSRVAVLISESLGFPINGAAAMKSTDREPLIQSLRRKNFLWQQYYHPTNWAFLYGDRQHVPAGRSHLDSRKRWFIKEVGQLPGLIKESETDIHRYASEMSAEVKKN